MKSEERVKQIIKDFHIRRYCPEEHYETACDWWSHYRKTWVDPDFLSELGIVVYKNDTPLVFMWLYGSNSKLGQIGFPLGNPKVGPRTRFYAIVFGLQEAEELLKTMGVKAISALSDSRALSRIMLNHGYDLLTPHDFLMKTIV